MKLSNQLSIPNEGDDARRKAISLQGETVWDKSDRRSVF